MPVSATGKPQNLVRGHGGDLIIIELEPHIAAGANPGHIMTRRTGASLVREHRLQRIVSRIVAAQVVVEPELLVLNVLLLFVGFIAFDNVNFHFLVFQILEFRTHWAELVLQFGGTQLKGIEVNGEFDILQHLGIYALLSFVLKAHELYGEIGWKSAHQVLKQDKISFVTRTLATILTVRMYFASRPRVSDFFTSCSFIF